jgi:hypothetical protein
MNDINYPLRKAYFAALTATGLPVYYQGLPNNQNPEEYIVFRSINSNEASTKNSADTETQITVEIHTYQEYANQGRLVETIADEIYQYVYAISQFVLPMDGVQMVSTELVSDQTNNYGYLGNRMYIDRFITFKHNIFIGGTGNGTTPIIIVNGISRFTYIATGGETSFVVGDAVGQNPICLFKDGIQYTLVSPGPPTDKRFIFDSPTGTVSFEQPCEVGEILFFLYD